MFSFLFWFWLLLRFVLVRGFRARLRNPVVCDGISGTRWNRVLLGQGWRRIAVDLGCYGLLCRLRRQLSFQKGRVAMGNINIVKAETDNKILVLQITMQIG